LLLEEVRKYEEEKSCRTFKKVEFFRKVKEFTRLSKVYADICGDI
jgi:hypothetical protein